MITFCIVGLVIVAIGHFPMDTYVIFTSHRARDTALRQIDACGFGKPQAYYSWKRDTGKGVYLLSPEEMHVIERCKGWRRLRGPFDDLMKCWDV